MNEVVTVSNIAAKAVSALFALVVGFLATTTLANTDDNAAIADRLKPVGNVCIEGEECATASPVASASSGGGARSSEDIYTTKCAACHGTGVLSAPKYGTADWTDRANKGMETLLANAINGFNAMPPKGTCSDCSDQEMQDTIQYMIDSAN